MNLSVALVLASILSTGRADCPSGGSFDPAALRVVVVNAGEDDPAVARAVAELGANMVATVSPPNLRSALAAQAAGLAYLPWLSSREVARLPFDVARVEAIRRMPAIAGLHYLDEDVTEGYTSAATQARTYGILKALFPDRLALYATRLDIVAVRWRAYRIYPKQFVSSALNPSEGGIKGYRQEGAGYPSIFNIELDQREEANLGSTDAWVISYYMRLIAEYQESLEKYPNPKAVNLTQFGRPSP